MNNFFLKLTTLLLFFITSLQINAKDYNFDLIQTNEKIGALKITVESDTKSQTTTYKYYSECKMNIGIDLLMIDDIRAIFVKDTLQECSVISKLNNKERFNIVQKLFEDKSAYKREVNKKVVNMMEKPLTTSYITLFINMPNASTKEVFSEYYGKKLIVKQTGKNTFSVGNASNSKTIFYYDEKGLFVKATVITSVGTYDIVPAK